MHYGKDMIYRFFLCDGHKKNTVFKMYRQRNLMICSTLPGKFKENCNPLTLKLDLLKFRAHKSTRLRNIFMVTLSCFPPFHF